MTPEEIAQALEEAARIIRKTASRQQGVSLPTLLTVKQMAENLSVTPRHLQNLMARRAIPYVKLGKSVRFNPDKVAESLERMTIKPKKNSFSVI